MWIWASLVGCTPAASGCNAGEGLCTGSLVVDLDGERPVFDVEGMEDAEVQPDTLNIRVCPASVTIWDLWSIAPGSFPLGWGEVPEDAELDEAPNEDFPFVLEAGTTYVASIGVRDKDIDGLFSFVQEVSNYGTGGSAVAGWSGAFVWGDPDSYVPDVGCGMGDSGEPR